MSTDANKAVVRRFIEQVLDKMDTSLVDELFAPNYANHMVPGGRDGFKQFFAMLRSSFPGMQWGFRIERMMADGEYVMARATMRVTNGGKEASGSGLAEFRVTTGKIAEDWPISEVAGLMQQVGVALPQG
jgi:predicted SnoaL-like aldol condensation-catalyzing enzyme